NANGAAMVGGNGIRYSARSASYNSFGWDGSFVQAWVDATYIGQLATVGWVNGNFKLASAYTPNQNVDNGASPTFGTVTANSNVAASGNVTGNILGANRFQSSGDANFVTYLDGSANRIMQYASGWYHAFAPSSSQYVFYNSGGSPVYYAEGLNGNFHCGGACY